MSDLELAAEGDMEAQARLCRAAFGTGKEMEALRWGRLAAGQGHPVGQGALGVMYRDGCAGLEVDYKEAVRYFSLAADHGSAAAMCNLGAMYRQGLGCPTDLTLAKEWNEKSAQLGHAGGLCNLGEILLTRGPYHDAIRAKQCFQAATAQGDEVAAAHLRRLEMQERFLAMKAMSLLGSLAVQQPRPMQSAEDVTVHAMAQAADQASNTELEKGTQEATGAEETTGQHE